MVVIAVDGARGDCQEMCGDGNPGMIDDSTDEDDGGGGKDNGDDGGMVEEILVKVIAAGLQSLFVIITLICAGMVNCVDVQWSSLENYQSDWKTPLVSFRI